ncbi:hypoxanthine phosphoribosyltransferase [Spiroplasma endosymbiont of Amphibalanus improvisus]|uniref:hypoxanthine phosphoribosyltransferase n=1 Tax=Spiroplasma endosymbiont of Amphibalanus improvisus TaxID=3066327 RepID=UPI00313DCD18
MSNQFNSKLKLLISEEEIKAKIKEYAKKIESNYKNKNLLVVGLLNGSFIFTADLVREINIPIEIDFISCSSYQGQKSTGIVNIYKGLRTKNLKNKSILLVEDILDTGTTIINIYNYLLDKNAKEIKILTLLDKKEKHLKFDIDYDSLFEVEDNFLIGYGIDLDEKYRNLKSVYTYKN